MDAPTAYNPSGYGSLEECPEGVEELCEKICQSECTIANLRSVRDYFQNKIDQLNKIAENDLTIEDFEKAKKEDLDGDQGKGEGDKY